MCLYNYYCFSLISVVILFTQLGSVSSSSARISPSNGSPIVDRSNIIFSNNIKLSQSHITSSSYDNTTQHFDNIDTTKTINDAEETLMHSTSFVAECNMPTPIGNFRMRSYIYVHHLECIWNLS